MTPEMAALFRKYNVPGPRYTSYPTVPHWHQSPTPQEWLTSIDHALTQGKALSQGAALYLHIPFCQSLCTYCGCNTRISRNKSVAAPYVETLIKEWTLYRESLGRLTPTSLSISEIHLGGGTPTFLSVDELQKLLMGILKTVEVLPDFEFSLEADPRVTTQEHLAALRELGFRRLSLGIQDFDPRVQAAVNRHQSEEQVRTITDWARHLGYTSINYDLIYGLPFQNIQSIENTISIVRRLQPDRIAFYSYAHVPWIKPGQRRFTEQDLPSGDQKRALYELGRGLLEEAGYAEVGMDHFALSSDSLWKAAQTGTLHRNFMGYTSRRVSPIIPLGVSSIGDSWTVFAQNEKLLETYQSRVHQGEIPIFRGHVLSPEDQILRKHILNLMTRFETHWRASEDQTEFLESQVTPLLIEPVQDQLAQLAQNGIRVTEKGRPFLRNICMAFDAHLHRHQRHSHSPTFSQTV